MEAHLRKLDNMSWEIQQQQSETGILLFAILKDTYRVFDTYKSHEFLFF